MKYLSWYFIGVLAVMAAVGYAHAESAPVVGARVMAGLFCQQQKDLTYIVTNGRADQTVFDAAMAVVNKEQAVCVVHADSRVLVESMTFLKTDTYGTEKLFLYRASVSGFVIDNMPVKVNPSGTLYVYMSESLKPEHVDYDS